MKQNINTTAKAKNTRKPKVTKVVNLKGEQRLVYSVPPCVEHYLEASINPFDAPPGACLPCDLLPLPSQKIRSFTKGSFQTGTTGYGYVQFSQCMASDSQSVVYTTATSVGGANTAPEDFTNFGTSNPGASAPYVQADFVNKSVMGRAVAYGLRVRCTASAMSRGGSYVTCEDEQHVGFSGESYNIIKSNALSRTKGIPLLVDPDQWDVAVCSSGPATTQELQYGNQYGITAGGIFPAPLIVMVNSAVPGMTFDYEGYIHYEVQGNKVTSLKTKSHASPSGFSASVEALKGSVIEHGPVSPENGRSILESFKDFLLQEGPQLLNIAGGAARMLMGDEAGLLNVASGGFKLLTDVVNPHEIPSRKLTEAQRSILRPDAPALDWR